MKRLYIIYNSLPVVLFKPGSAVSARYIGSPLSCFMDIICEFIIVNGYKQNIPPSVQVIEGKTQKNKSEPRMGFFNFDEGPTGPL